MRRLRDCEGWGKRANRRKGGAVGGRGGGNGGGRPRAAGTGIAVVARAAAVAAAARTHQCRRRAKHGQGSQKCSQRAHVRFPFARKGL